MLHSAISDLTMDEIKDKYAQNKRAVRLSKNLIALYFYNNSNNVAILLPQRASKRRKACIYRLFLVPWIIPTPKYKTNFNCFCLGILT